MKKQLFPKPDYVIEPVEPVEKVEEIFACYEKKVTVTVKTAIED